MTLEIEPKEVIDAYSTPIIQQTSFWSNVKQHHGIPSAAFDFKIKNSDLYLNVGGYSYTQADFIVFFEYLNSTDYVAYLPYGPEIEPSEENQGSFLEELSESLRSHLPNNCLALRYDLNWESHWCKEDDFDENGIWKGSPAKTFQELRLNYGTCNWNLKKSNSNILPAHTILLDLRNEEEQILAQMKSKTRYNINLSKRKGIEVRNVGIEGLDIWYQLYCETAIRNGLNTNSLEYFRMVFTTKMEQESKDVQVKLLVAYTGDQPLAAMFLVLSSHRATYLYGASSSEHRNLMPTYALQWEAIRLAKANACTEYDMFGIAPRPEPSHPMYGLYKFKQGFGGQIYHQLGCWDYPLDPDKYAVFQAYEMNRQGYYQQ
ncbi:lipid II:glycine glycyltransferase (peptidoglycan interpeptide bridge formation enzyme) [Bacteroides reticulotermitis]|uniref:Lipid II:glycine glycyltransferase (Peptidoglycan interpeptide bridge formation enzyme) n=1 Tax=Bacteroides reticulotermitis TaxID=1133319 RepID=A0A840D1M1_9BACE|nr:peptidoglycan bridge formation glycyltransferase FemA/FemB family protein [Bacteroides reticulotermitis]MBB4044709.1 lipid II:glycine glycyltransferase (peptidoglycan interpeptide bridge formation enzyme) [Bacteroides reticulotermitis]